MEGDIFHILNRGVEKRKIFLRQKDYLRFVHNLYDFNNADNVFLSYYNRRGQHNYRTNYGTARSVGKECPFGLKRQFLHALSLEFTHPNGSRLKLEADLPEDLERVLRDLQQD